MKRPLTLSKVTSAGLLGTLRFAHKSQAVLSKMRCAGFRSRVLFLAMFLYAAILLAIDANGATKRNLDQSFQLIGSRLLPANEIISLAVEKIPKDVENVLVIITTNGKETFRKLVPVLQEKEGERSWMVEIGPFVPKSQVHIRFEILKPITDDQRKAFLAVLNKALGETAASINKDFTGVAATEVYHDMLRTRFIEAVKKLENIKSMRTNTGEPFETAFEKLFRSPTFAEKLSEYISATQTISNQEASLTEIIAELRGAVKEKNLDKALQSVQDAEKQKRLRSFWTTLQDGKMSPAELCQESELDLKEALEFAKSAKLCDLCLTYYSGICLLCTDIKSGKAYCDSIGKDISDLVALTTEGLRNIDVETLDLEIRDIEYWAGFDVGYFALTQSKNTLPAFLIDIHPWKIDPSAKEALWGNEPFYKLLSLSAGMGLSSLGKQDREDRWYFVGFGLRLNTYFRIHFGATLTFDKDSANRNMHAEFTCGVSLNVREVAHVLTLFSGVSQQSGEKE